MDIQKYFTKKIVFIDPPKTEKQEKKNEKDNEWKKHYDQIMNEADFPKSTSSKPRKLKKQPTTPTKQSSKDHSIAQESSCVQNSVEENHGKTKK